MKPEEELKAYEHHLVQALLDQPERRQAEPPGSFQVCMGNQSLGLLECDFELKAEKIFSAIPTQGLIELRSSSGLLIGSLSSEPQQQKSAKFQAGNFFLTLDLRTQKDKGILHLTAQKLVNVQAIPSSRTTASENRLGLKSEKRDWSLVALVAQLLLVVGVMFLVGDRLYQNTYSSRESDLTVASQQQQLQEIRQQLATLQNTLDSSSVVSVDHTSISSQRKADVTAASGSGLSQSTPDSLLTKKPKSFQEGLLQARPVWVRFKKDLPDARVQEIFKEISVQSPARIGSWHYFNLNLAASQSPDEALKPWQELGDVEIVTTSVITRHVQVRFKKDVPENEVNGFFEEIRVKRPEPKDNWYNIDLMLPESVEPEPFINELHSRKIIDGIHVDMNHLPFR